MASLFDGHTICFAELKPFGDFSLDRRRLRDRDGTEAGGGRSEVVGIRLGRGWPCRKNGLLFDFSMLMLSRRT